MSEWRLQGQEKYLMGAALHRAEYKPYRDGWDHDHCAFCWRKFSKHSGNLTEGYATEDRYHWICEDCYMDFKALFQWTVVS